MCGIRVEFHVASLGHALPRVHLLDPGPQVIPDLVQPDLFQSVGILGPVGRHSVTLLRLPTMPSFSLLLLSLAPPSPRLVVVLSSCCSALRAWCPSGSGGTFSGRDGPLVCGEKGRGCGTLLLHAPRWRCCLPSLCHTATSVGGAPRQMTWEKTNHKKYRG